MYIAWPRPSPVVRLARPTSAVGDRDGSRIVVALALVAGAASLLFDLHEGILGPPWLVFDETGTGAFASEPSPAGLIGQIQSDSNAPLYYVVMWVWARAFGVSNLSLHVPSLLFTLAAPVIAWLGLRRARPMLGVVWAALLALWLPGSTQAGEARCYAMLLCLSTAAAVAALDAWEAPTRRRALFWAVLSCLATLTHYYAGLLALVQGLALMMRYRGRYRASWPAILAFLPALGWIAWHGSRLAAYARPGVSWYEALTLDDVPSFFWFFLGPPLSQVALLASVAMSLILRSRAGDGPIGDRAADVPPLAVGILSLVVAVLCFGLGALRPMLVLRYLTPFAPGILLLVAAGVVAASRSRWQPPAMLIGGMLVSISFAVASDDVAVAKLFTFEKASAWLAETVPPRVAFFWDNPATEVIPERELAAIGGFFLRRGGAAVDVRPVYPTSGADMNAAVAAAAGPDGAVLWLYDRLVRDTTAARRPPRLGEGADGLECRDFGGFNMGVVACRRRPGEATSRR